MELYKDKLPVGAFKKVAAFASRVSEEPDNWPMELTNELYKQLPYLSDYDVNVNLDRVEPQRGFAFGWADVHNKTERPEQEHAEVGLPHVRIPLVVQEHMVRPFATMVDGEKVRPLNEERMRELLFNPSSFDLSITPPQDPSLVEPLMPPHRSGIGMGGDYKLASASPEALLFDTLTEKTAFKHISKEQWDAMYNSLEVQKLMHEYQGQRDHPAIQNKVYEMAAKIYGFHPKPEPPPPQKVMEFHQKQQEKAQKEQQKQTDKAKKMLQEGTKLMNGAGKAKTSAMHEAPSRFEGDGGLQDVVDQWMAPLDDRVRTRLKKEKTAGAEWTSEDGGETWKRASLLLKIAHTIRAEDWENFVQAIVADPDLQAGFARSGVRDLLVQVEEEMAKASSADDRLQAIADNISPTVVTIQKLPGGDFLVKSANNEAFSPGPEAQGEMVPQDQMAQNIGQDQAQGMLPGQTATAVADPVEAAEPEVPSAEPVAQFGEYLVQDLMGNQVMGWVFPTTLAWDGQFSEQPVALFTNGSAFALQDGVAGELIGKSVGLPISPPRGEGVFYEVSRDGARATAPVTVRGGMTGPDGGEMYNCTDLFGNQFAVHLSQGITEPMMVSDSEYALPQGWKFMALNNQTQLVSDGQQMNKTSAVRQAQSTVTLFWNGAFNLEGGCGLDKVASSFRQELDPVSAEFMLGLLGVSGADAKQKLAQARKKGAIKIAGLKQITTLGERYEKSKQASISLAEKLPDLRRDLVKEAAGLDDDATVDKVLALNFVNPENLSSFVDHLPELEETSENLASMLLSSYLGMNELPEESLEKAMRGMEEVVLQLKAVQHAES